MQAPADMLIQLFTRYPLRFGVKQMKVILVESMDTLLSDSEVYMVQSGFSFMHHIFIFLGKLHHQLFHPHFGQRSAEAFTSQRQS